MKIKQKLKKIGPLPLLFIILFLLFSLIFNFILIGDRMSGESMLPVLKPLDMVFSVSTDNIQIGDVIVFESSKGVDTIHRVIEIRGDRYITKGDNNQWHDWNENVTLENIKGKMVFRIPFGKLIS